MVRYTFDEKVECLKQHLIKYKSIFTKKCITSKILKASNIKKLVLISNRSLGKYIRATKLKWAINILERKYNSNREYGLTRSDVIKQYGKLVKLHGHNLSSGDLRRLGQKTLLSRISKKNISYTFLYNLFKQYSPPKKTKYIVSNHNVWCRSGPEVIFSELIFYLGIKHNSNRQLLNTRFEYDFILYGVLPNKQNLYIEIAGGRSKKYKKRLNRKIKVYEEKSVNHLIIYTSALSNKSAIELVDLYITELKSKGIKINKIPQHKTRIHFANYNNISIENLKDEIFGAMDELNVDYLPSHNQLKKIGKGALISRVKLFGTSEQVATVLTIKTYRSAHNYRLPNQLKDEEYFINEIIKIAHKLKIIPSPTDVKNVDHSINYALYKYHYLNWDKIKKTVVKKTGFKEKTKASPFRCIHFLEKEYVKLCMYLGRIADRDDVIENYSRIHDAMKAYHAGYYSFIENLNYDEEWIY